MTVPNASQFQGQGQVKLDYKPTKTVLVLGASYAGHTAVQSLVQGLPQGWRVVVLERNTHANHLYAFPRVAVLPSHEKKVFIPYTNIFKPVSGVPSYAASAGHVLIHGCLTSLDLAPQGRGGKLPFGRGVANYRPLHEGASCCRDPRAAEEETMQIRYDYLVYALGCHLPPPINLWSSPSAKKDAVEDATLASTSTAAPGTCCMSSVSSKLERGLNLREDGQSEAEAQSATEALPPRLPPCRGSKQEGVSWLQEAQSRVRQAKSVIVIGGGALGVQFASDIAAYYGTASSPPSPDHLEATRGVPVKKVTLLCSSKYLLPRFDKWMHDQSLEALQKLGVEVLLSARADLSQDAMQGGQSASGEERIIKTLDGREVRGELVLFCTGQKPCTNYLYDALSPSDRASIDSKGMCKINRHLQLAVPSPARSSQEVTGAEAEVESEPQTRKSIDNIFVVGDVADAFGALNAGHTAWAQAKLAAANICHLIHLNDPSLSAVSAAEGVNEGESEATSSSGSTPSSSSASSSSSSSSASEEQWPSTPPASLEKYTPPLPGIKVSLGLDLAIQQSGGKHAVKRGREDGLMDDLNTGVMWSSRGLSEEGGYVE